MSSFSSIGNATSGLQASQLGLTVTGHNLTNMNTPGYTRQQVLQHDSSYLNKGVGLGVKQVGTGVGITEIRQIRNDFADVRFRTENSVLSFYTTKQSATYELESILGEPYGETLGGVFDDFWKQTQKLSLNPQGIEERMAFIQTAHVMIGRANHIMDGLIDYQYNLNNEVVESVNTINSLLDEIQAYNEAIMQAELNGDRANDLRDQRNMLLDELSYYMDIDYYEDKNGQVVVSAEGREVINQGFVTKIELKSTGGGSPFVKPVWSDTGKDVFDFSQGVNSSNGNDSGQLKSLLIIRGNAPADSDTDWDDIALNNNHSVSSSGNAFLIPKMQKELSLLIDEVTRIVNDSLNGLGTDGEPSVPVFVEINGRMQVNPLLMEEGGYERLGVVPNDGEPGDNSLVIALLDEWNKSREWPPPTKTDGMDDPTKPSAPTGFVGSISDYYRNIVTELGQEGFYARSKVTEKQAIVVNIDNERLSIGGVSQDEEYTNMIKYQYSYTASARMINVLDEMLDTVINRM